ncbi:sodium/potassium-transporting ATPase subunit beta [Parasteatoda tepidariorum]|uniref:sodium/potassium-transporting ATPase subunit beta n=1 Tax=Parasteatoda tepidariorum TaxID=114398 RepID=UPI00077FA2F3|nr:sodium/potassium-transporting ATPase subunit beta [Parasteatoda tepidariorum]
MGEKDGDIMKSSRDSEDKGAMYFIWNPDKREFCGRSGSSWLKIGVFYVIFYLLLAGFWTVMLLVFYQTLDYYTPRWQLGDSRIGTNPGLGFRPLPHPDNVDSTLIWFTHGSAREWDYWVTSLDQYLQPYTGGRQFGEHVRSCDFSSHYPEPHVCNFHLEDISQFCSKANNFGFDVGRPCILLKINRIYGWKPEPYSNFSLPATMPEHVRTSYDPNYVYISCDGENPADKENIGPITYYPPNGGIPNYYFPFTNLDGYLSPFVFVRFMKPATGVLINIECKAWAANIKHDRTDRMGSVHLELLID